MVKVFKKSCLFILVILSCASTLASNIKDVEKLILTKQCLDCNLVELSINNSEGESDFMNLNVSGSNLTGAKISGTFNQLIFKNVDLSFSNLNLNVTSVSFSSGMYNSDFSSSNLSHANLLGDFYHANFSDSFLDSLNLDVGPLELDCLSAPSLNESCTKLSLHFMKSKFVNTSFKGANLKSGVFLDSDFTGADFTDADLSYADFSDSNITEDQIKVAKNICGLTLPNSDVIVATKQTDGSMKFCDGYVSTKK